jgi:hypothetical protein
VIAVGSSDEFVTRHLEHRGKDAFVEDAALPKLCLDHALAAIGEVVIEHGESFAWRGVELQGVPVFGVREFSIGMPY